MKKIVLLLFISLIVSSNSTSPIVPVSSSEINTKNLVFAYFDSIENPVDDLTIKSYNTHYDIDNGQPYHVLDTVVQLFPKDKNNSDLKKNLIEQLNPTLTNENKIKQFLIDKRKLMNEPEIKTALDSSLDSPQSITKTIALYNDWPQSITRAFEECNDTKPYPYSCNLVLRTVIEIEKYNELYQEWKKQKNSNNT